QAVIACVLHKAYYGAETWWLGRTCPGPRQTSNQVGEHLEKLTKAILVGARAVLPPSLHLSAYGALILITHFEDAQNRLLEIADKPADLPAINPLQYAPWHPRESRAPMGRTKEQAAADFTFLCSSLSYGHGKEVFDAEVEAALAGAQAAIICLNNLEVATRLLSPSTGSSQEVFESFYTLAATWPLRERLPHTK
ncbi:hypothetical protein TSTA_009090, partial [Talaromyces stipitatus ATCC 10500]